MIRWRHTLNACLLVLFTISAPDAARADPLRVTFSATASGSTPTIHAKTNLPDGMKLMVSLLFKPPECQPHCGYAGQASVTVNKGEIVAGPFSNNGRAMSPGSYLLEITSPIAELEPPSVRSTIGMNGENLAGPNLSPELVPGLGPTVHYTREMDISLNLTPSIPGAAPSNQHTERPPTSEAESNFEAVQAKQDQVLEDARAMVRQDWVGYEKLIEEIEIGYKCGVIDEVSAGTAVLTIQNSMQDEKNHAGLIDDRATNIEKPTMVAMRAAKAAVANGICARLTPAWRGRLRSIVSNLMP